MAYRLRTGMVFLLVACVACSGGERDSAAVKSSTDKQAAAMDNARSAGKLAAPVSIQYTVLGTPIISQPLAIEIRVSSPQPGQTLQLSYFINDTDSLMFSDAQPASIDVAIPADEDFAARQVRVVPLREGRLYLNVTAEVRTANGSMLKSIAIPIVVGNSSATPQLNGELKETADGETVISMPALEN